MPTSSRRPLAKNPLFVIAVVICRVEKSIVATSPLHMAAIVLASFAMSTDFACAQGFLSQLTAPLKEGFDPMVVRGHFDVDGQRYYCLKNAKTGVNKSNAVQGQPSVSQDGTVSIKTPAQSILSCDKADQKGILVTAAYASNASGSESQKSASFPGTSNAADDAGRSSSVDASSFNILGVKLGDSTTEAEKALREAYPKIVRVDRKTNYKYGLFTTPELNLGTQYVAGLAVAEEEVVKLKKPGDAQPMNYPITGAGELGDEADAVSVVYVWPAAGSVVAVSRYHGYDHSHRQDIRTLPSVDSIRNGLKQKFGDPSITLRSAQTSFAPGIFIGGSYPTITWVWAKPGTMAYTEYQANKSAAQCAVSTVSAFSFATRKSPTLGKANPLCGTYLLVSIETFQNDYVESLTEQLIDSQAFDKASNDFINYLKSGSDAESAGNKNRADAKTPQL